MEESGENPTFRWLMIFGIIGPIVAIGFVIIDILVSPWYSWSRNALSDLGVHPYSFLFNGGLLFEAATNVLFVIGLKKLRLASTPVSVMLIVSGLALGLVGIFNEHHEPFHLIFALIYFILFPIGIIIFSLTKMTSGKGYIRPVGVLLAIIGLAFIIVGILEDFNTISTGLGLGFYEFVEAVMIGIWPIYTGAVFFRK